MRISQTWNTSPTWSVRNGTSVYAASGIDACCCGVCLRRFWSRDFCILDNSDRGLIITLSRDSHARVMLSLPPTEAWPLYARLRWKSSTKTARHRQISLSG